MRERPIIMSAPMVRAILAGKKTQTRRVVKPYGRDNGFCIMETENRGLWPYRSDDGESCFITIDGYLNEVALRCPYGVPGDRLWVRETWLQADRPLRDDGRGGIIVYRAAYPNDQVPLRWRSSIHMPRWASRITLEITGVRVEWLQDISEADAMAEGIGKPAGAQFWYSDIRGSPRPGDTPQWAYRNLWESIHGAGSWDANPWVWVVAFRRVA